MEKIKTLSETKKIFQNKKIVQFLDDAYNLSKSKRTREGYRHVLYSFNKFCCVSYGKDLLEIIDELKEKPLENVLDVFLDYKRYLDNYTTQRKLSVSNSSKRVYLSVLKNFFRSCGIKVHHEDIQDHVKIGRKTRVRKFALDIETVTKIIDTLDQFSFKTLTVLLASTGMRVMEAITLQMSDFDFQSYPVSVTIRAGETKTNEGRSVYLTKECASMMEQLIRSKPTLQPYLFDKSTEPINIYKKYSRAIRESLHKIGLHKILENGVNQITVHSFRSFFRTYAGHVIDRDFAESFIGHRFYLSEYQNMPEKEKKNQFLKLEPHLTFRHIELKTHTLNPEIIELHEQVSDLQNKIRMLGNKFLAAKA